MNGLGLNSKYVYDFLVILFLIIIVIVFYYFDEIKRENFTPYFFMGIGTTLLKNTYDRDNPVGKNKKLIMNIPFGIGFKYLINKQFSLAIEFEVKKTFNDNLRAAVHDSHAWIFIFMQWVYAVSYVTISSFNYFI